MCGCSGSTTQWKPVQQQDGAQTENGEPLTPNERIQQARHAQQAQRHWGPGTWDGRARVPAGK